MKRAFALILAMIIFAAAVNFSAKAAEEPINNIVFEPVSGGKFIYCNNPEMIGNAHLSSIENSAPMYLMTNKGLREDNYTLFFSHSNVTDYDIEVDVQFKAKGKAVIEISAAGFEVAHNNDTAWTCLNSLADYRQAPIKQLDGLREYVPNKFAPVRIELDGDSRWISEFLYNFKELHYLQCASLMTDFKIISGEVEVNVAALKFSGTLGDRSNHSENAADGKYVSQDHQIKGIASSLPAVETNLNFDITENTALGENIPFRIFNQYYPDGRVNDKFATHLNPLADDYSKAILCESDMLCFTYKDSEKLKLYGSAVPESEKDDLWVFDTKHSDATAYKAGMPFDIKNFKPNFTVDKDAKSIESPCILGNYLVSERYNITAKNTAETQRTFEFYLKTGADVLVGIYDENGVLLNPFTMETDGGFYLDKPYTWYESKNERVAAVPLKKGETKNFTVEVILPTNNYGGILCSAQISSEIPQYPGFTETPRFGKSERVSYQAVGDEFIKFETGAFWRSKDTKEWEKIITDFEKNAEIRDVITSFEINRAGQNQYAFRYNVYDLGFEPPIYDKNAFAGKIYLTDENLQITAEKDFKEYVYAFGFSQGNYYAKTKGKVYISADFENWQESVLPFPLGNPENTAFESSEQRQIKKSGRYYYYFKSLKKDNRDIETKNILSVSKDGVYFFDYSLPDRLVTVDGVTAGEKEITVDCRSDTYTFSLQNIEEKLAFSALINFNGTYLGFDAVPVVIDGSTLVPIRFFFEKLGAAVAWDNGLITVNKDDKTIVFKIGDKNCKVNGKTIEMTAQARLVEEKTMVPLRFLAELLSYNVSWAEATRTAYLTK